MSCDACKRLTQQELRRAPCRFCRREAEPFTAPTPLVPPQGYLRLYKHAGMWVTELWLGDVGSRRSSAYDEFKGTYVGSETAGDALTRGLEMLEAQTTKT